MHEHHQSSLTVNVTVEVYSLKSQGFQLTTIYTRGNGTLSYTISCGENSAHFLQLMQFTSFSNFRPTRYPSVLGGQRRYGMSGFAQYLYTSINFSDLRVGLLVNVPCATILVGNCEANQSSWHEAFVFHECPLGGTTFDALLCSLYWLFVEPLVVLRCLDLKTNTGLRHDRRRVYALDHNPHNLPCVWFS